MSTVKARIKEAVILKLEPRLEMQMLNLQIQELELQLIAARRKRRALRHQLRFGPLPAKTNRELLNMVFARKMKTLKVIPALVVAEEEKVVEPPIPPAPAEPLVSAAKLMTITPTVTEAPAPQPKRTGFFGSLFSSKADQPMTVTLTPRDRMIHGSNTVQKKTELEKALADPESDLGKKVRSKIHKNLGIRTDPSSGRIIKKSLQPVAADDDDDMSEAAIDNFARKIGATTRYVDGDRKKSERIQMEIRQREDQKKKR